jgi:riboflavin kinase/FMN adenylyltransferase
MGRRYSLFGTVAHGRGRGRELGFPTANLECGDQLVPGEGVYAAIAVLEGTPGKTYAAAVSIGHTPTFEDAGLLVEAHLLDYGGTLSGIAMRLEFLSWVRKQRKFEGPAQLAEQIERDVKQIRSEIANLRKSEGAPIESESA